MCTPPLTAFGLSQQEEKRIKSQLKRSARCIHQSNSLIILDLLRQRSINWPNNGSLAEASDDTKLISISILFIPRSPAFHSLHADFNFDGDKIYDFIVIFSIKRESLPFTLNPFVINAFALRRINLNVILGRAALCWLQFGHNRPKSIRGNRNILSRRLSMRLLRGETKYLLWRFKYFDIMLDRLLKTKATWGPRTR